MSGVPEEDPTFDDLKDKGLLFDFGNCFLVYISETPT